MPSTSPASAVHAGRALRSAVNRSQGSSRTTVDAAYRQYAIDYCHARLEWFDCEWRRVAEDVGLAAVADAALGHVT